MSRPILSAGRLAGLLVVHLLATVGCSLDSTPETPENAVMEYLTTEQVGEDGSGRLCESLRSGERPEDMEVVERVTHEASAFGEGVLSEGGDSAVVALEILFAPSPRGAVGEPWQAMMVKAGGTWKVCGFEPRGE